MKLQLIALLVIFPFFWKMSVFQLESGRSGYYPQQSDTVVKVRGIVLDQTTGNPVASRIIYEKLPYFDDVGKASSTGDGFFEIYLLNNTSYSLMISADGYDRLSEELKIVLDSGALEYTKEFLLAPDQAHQKLVLENLIFERGRSKISAGSFEELDRLVSWLNERPGLVIQLEGHTDFEGNASANVDLSKDRVDAVKQYLTSKGIKKSRVLTKAFGGSEPLTLERTDEGKRKNRRVEVRIIRD